MTEDELIEAMAKAMFEDEYAHLGTTPDSPSWTWELAEENVKQYWRRKARVALQALKAKGCKVTKMRNVTIGPLSADAKDRLQCRVGGRVVGYIWERSGVYGVYGPHGRLLSEHHGLRAAKEAAEKRWVKP